MSNLTYKEATKNLETYSKCWQLRPLSHLFITLKFCGFRYRY